jgi:hypothetical protein
VILTILPGKPESAGGYSSIRESLANALEQLARPIEQIRELHLRGLAGAERAAATDASAPIEHCVVLLKSNANALRDPEMVDLPDVYDALERAGAGIIAGIFLMRGLQTMFHACASGKSG